MAINHGMKYSHNQRTPGYANILLARVKKPRLLRNSHPNKDPQHLVRMNIQNKFETLSLETCHTILIKNPLCSLNHGYENIQMARDKIA